VIPKCFTAETYILACAGLFSFSIAYAYLTGISEIRAVFLIMLGFFGLDTHFFCEKK
jgi:hypothetical protein